MAALGGIGFEALWNRGPVGLKVLAAGLALAALVQLVEFGRPSFKAQDENLLRMGPSTAESLRQRCGLEGRVANDTPDAQSIGQCQAAGVDHVGGYEPMMLRRYSEAINAARGVATDTPMVIVASVGDHPVIRMLAARVNLHDRIAGERLGGLPRCWVVNHAVVFEDQGERLKRMASGAWNPRKTVILESFPTDIPPVPTVRPAGRASVLFRTPGYYEIEAECEADGYLVLSEAYYPGWTADIDGRAAEVLPANHLIQTIRLSAGKHVVRFRYRSRFLALGFAVAALAALVPVGLLVRRHRRQLPLQGLPGAP
jgi:hypothetical protein